ncbi:unnamed protein product, partial [Urochloa humidicola]
LKPPSSVSRAAVVRGLGGAKRLAAPLLWPFGPSAEPAAVDDAKLRAADALAHRLQPSPPAVSRVPKILAGRRSCRLLSPPSKIPTATARFVDLRPKDPVMPIPGGACPTPVLVACSQSDIDFTQGSIE